MTELRRFGLADLLFLLLVLGVAAAARAGYLVASAESGRTAGPLLVQDRPPRLRNQPADTTLLGRSAPNEQDALVHNLKERSWFGCPAPLASGEEATAHIAPGYPGLVAVLARVSGEASLDRSVRWLQVGLGTLTAGLYFLFARRAFRSLAVATLAGLMSALHLFWVINTADVNDGVVATFLLALALYLGVRAGQTAEASTSLLYGLSLAALALVRAATLPFAFVAIAWFLLRSRSQTRGWLCALLAFLGFANGLAPWTVRNLQEFGELLPIVDSTYLHLWIGNNTQANGGPLSPDPFQTLPTAELAKVTKQPERYGRLSGLVWDEVRDHPAATLHRRLAAGLSFVFGAQWVADGRFVEERSAGESSLPDWLGRSYPQILQGTMLALLMLAALGWRWSFGWRFEAMPLSLALIWIPLPFLLGHAETLSGPRLPLDGVLLCYAAFALVCLVPGVGQQLLDGPLEEERRERRE
jgi:4-amino-4-deoxy-L-arabinose transferase-like glycosyltransferase